MPALSSMRTTTRPSFFAGHAVPLLVWKPSAWSVRSISTTGTPLRPSSVMRAAVSAFCFARVRHLQGEAR